MSGTSDNDRDGLPSDMPDAMVAKFREIQARSLGAALKEEGIPVTSTPKQPAPEPKEEPEAAEEELELAQEPGDEDEDEDPFGDPAPVAARNARLEAVKTLKADALAKNIPEEIAKALAHNVSQKAARKFVDEYGSMVQSEPAGQPAPQPPTPSAGRSDAAALAEVSKLLDGAGEDEAATAVRSLFSAQNDRIAQLEAMVTETVAATGQQLRATRQAETMRIAGELAGRFPELVQNERIDPTVSRRAKALFQGDDVAYSGNVQASLEAASLMTYGLDGDRSRQKPERRPRSPDLEAPASYGSADVGPVSSREEEDILGNVLLKHRTAGPQRDAAFKQARAYIDSRNKAARPAKR